MPDYVAIGAVEQLAFVVIMMVIEESLLSEGVVTLKLVASKPSRASILPIFLRRSME